MLGQACGSRQLLPIEEAIHYLTDSPARLYGLDDRGRLADGGHADVVVLDPTTIGPGPVHMRFDLPGGAGRLYGEAEGIEHVLVNGERRRARAATSSTPGRARCCAPAATPTPSPRPERRRAR